MIDTVVDPEGFTLTKKCINQNCDLKTESRISTHCILHSNKRNKDILLFNQALKKYVEQNPNNYLDIYC